MSERILLACLLAITFFSCTNRYEKDMPTDFWFSIRTATEEYDSKNGHFTRRYMAGDSTVQAMIDNDLEEVYNLFTQYDFLSFPVEFDCKNVVLTSSSTSTISIYYKGKTSQSSYDFGCLYPVDQRSRAEKFSELQKQVWNIVKRQKAIKLMKGTDIIFL